MKTKILTTVIAAAFATAACSKETPKETPKSAVVEQKVIKTKDDVKAFQKSNGLTPDGVVGPKTRALMEKKGFKYEPAVAPKKADKKADKKGHELNLKTPPGKAIK